MEMGLGFAAPVSGLAIDENTAEIRIAAGRRVGDRAAVTTDSGIDLRNDTVTVAATRHGKGSVEFLPQWGDGSIRVRGEYPLSEAPYTVRVSLPSPERVAGERLRDQLRRAGVELTGSVRVATERRGRSRSAPSGGGDAGDSEPVVARLFSPPLADIMVPVLRESSNWTAEMLVLQVALARSGEGRYDDGIDALEAFLTEEVGIAVGQFALDDVCGLSSENLLSARAVVALLRFAWRAPWRDAFVTALARPGTGTLVGWPALPPVAAKTGSLKHTMSLAGIVDLGIEPSTVAGTLSEPILFAIFLNHDLRDRSVQRREIAALLQQWRRMAGSS
jgi:D-alanyl-D-alanine carboxypeptidase/D-alanyl-D-alanine-endopeptidase (penicillin-binding protein 4)